MEAAIILARSMSKGAGRTIRQRAHDIDGKADLVSHLGRAQRDAHSGGGDDIVAAGVADAGQAIVFGTNGDVKGSGSGARELEMFLRCRLSVLDSRPPPGYYSANGVA
jgi:hypothetical protein